MAKSIFEQIKADKNFNIEKSAKWFKSKVSTLVGNSYNMGAYMQNNQDQLKRTIKPGRMYAFRYDPKYKDTLPYYDVFPLVIPFRRQGMHFWGLNMHYLHPSLRAIVFDKLFQYYDDERSRMVWTWSMVKRRAIPGLNFAVKQYLVDHVRSRFLKIDEEDWKTAVFLPFQGFVGADAKDVWKMSKRS